MNLSPLALSKKKHKVCAWTTPEIVKLLRDRAYYNKVNMREEDTQSKLIAYGISLLTDLLYTDTETEREKAAGLMKKRITFYLNQEQFQDLLNIEIHWLGGGIKTNTSQIINVAILVYFEEYKMVRMLV